MRDMILVAQKYFSLNEVIDRLVDVPQLEATKIQNGIFIEDKLSHDYIRIELDAPANDDSWDPEDMVIYQQNTSDIDLYWIQFRNIDLIKQIILLAFNRNELLLDTHVTELHRARPTVG